MGKQHADFAGKCSKEMQQGNAAWKYSMGMYYVHVAGMCDMDFQYVNVARTQHGLAALRSDMDAAYTRNMNMQHGLAARTCGTGMQQGHAVRT
jgi:hypothetical protein